TAPAPRIGKTKLPKSCITRKGRSTVGISVVTMKGRVGSMHNAVTDLRLDSCMDITLISEEYFASLQDKPSVQQGMRMKLWQLTDKDCELGRFVRIPILVESTEEETLELEAEAYIVPKMTVPILLGEDFQLTYEITVARSVDKGTRIGFCRSPLVIPAQPVARSYNFQRLRPSAFAIGKVTLRAARDYKIRPQECRCIEVTGNLRTEGEWLIKKNLLPLNDDTALVVLNVLISARDPQVPISNTSTSLKYIRRGDIIGRKHDPVEYFDTPRSPEEKERLEAHALAVRAIIQSQLPTEQ
ncbi:hypothetical protein M413DRAFT_41718, partial [Hebeloma cylindrosporum]